MSINSNHVTDTLTPSTGTLTVGGTIGIGVTPESGWDTNKRTIRLGIGAFLFGSSITSQNIVLGVNAQFNGTDWKYLVTGNATVYSQGNGMHTWSSAANGTAGSTFSFSTAMSLDSNNNLNLGSGTSVDSLRYFDISNSNSGPSAGVIQRLIHRNAADTTNTTVDIIKYSKGGFYINNNDVATSNFTTFQVGGLERLTIDNVGNVLAKSSTGGICYGAGAGGSVTQATSKSTAVTLNKPCGRITMNAAPLAAGASVPFVFSNSLITPADVVLVCIAHGTVDAAFYSVRAAASSTYAYITLTNTSGSPLSEAVPINFVVIKGATS